MKRPDQGRPVRDAEGARSPIDRRPCEKYVDDQREEEQRTHDVHAEIEDVIAAP
jgi:hypothetical protein